MSVISPAKQALLQQRLRRRDTADVIGRRDDSVPLPLSFAQERLWFMEQYAPGTAAYVVPVALRLYGPLDAPAVRAALGAVTARHESLRLRVRADDEGRPDATIAPVAPPTVTEIDMPAGLDLPELDRRTRELISVDASLPFDLTQGPLLRATLIRRTADDHVLAISIHHIAADGWSTDLIIGEFAAAYDAEVTAAAVDDTEPPVRYGDFAAWQRTRLTADNCAADIAYWRTQLTGLAPLELPTDRPRPARQRYAGAGHGFTIDADLTGAVGRLATQLGATPYMVLLAAFQVLLWRHSGQEDFAVGSPVAGRTRPELEQLVGMFTNVLALRADLRGDPTFAELVARVRDTAIDAYSHQEVPFEHLVTELKVTRDTSRSPLFQVSLAMQNYHRATRTLHGGTQISWFVADAVATRFDLELYLYEHDGGLAAFFTYDTALFDPPRIERMAQHLVTLLQAALSDPDTAVADLPLMDAAATNAVLAAGRGPRVEVTETTLLDLLHRQASATPDAVALVDGDTTFTYAELHHRANRLAHHLTGCGVGPGTRVAVCAPRGAALVTAVLAAVKAGAAYVPLDPDYPARRLEFMLGDCQATLLLATADALAALPNATAAVVLDDDTAWRHSPATPPAVDLRPADPAYAIYTSGSTGRPKGAVNPHRAIVNRIDWMQRAFGLDATDAVLHKTPISFDVSVWELFWPLATGARLVLARPGGHRDPGYLCRLITDAAVTTVHFVPSMLAALLAHTDDAPGDLPGPRASLRRIVCSGEELPRHLALRCTQALPDAQLHNLYGPTEAAVDVTSWHCRPAELADAVAVPIGHPIQNVDLRIVDRRGRPQPVGVPGELCIGGTGLGDGYLHRAALTAQRFLPDPHGPAGTRLYRTGDRAALRADAAIEYLGRLDDQVKLRGIRIELGEIEAVLREQPGIADAVAALREDTPGDRRLVAYIVAAGGAEPVPEQLRDRLRDTLPEQLVPAAVVVLAQLPLNPSGKVDRRALPAPVRAATGGEAPQSPAEQLIAAAYARVLGVDEVGRDDGFFDLGGHSLLAVQVVARLRRPLAEAGLGPVSVMDLFRLPTVRQLAAHTGQDASTRSTRLLHELPPAAAEAGAHHTSLVCVPYGGGSAVVYQPLADALGSGYRLFSLALPGHDLGTAEQPRPMAQVVPDVVDEIVRHVPGPVVVYGHCGVGSAYALAIALGLQAAGRPPAAVYIGAMFPFARPKGRLLGLLTRLADRERLLSDRVYATWLVGMGVDLSGLDPQEVTTVIRAMRRDSIEAEDFYTALFAGAPPRLDAPIVSVVGDRDPATDLYRERFREWHAVTDRAAVVALDEGGHYFINHRSREVAEIITGVHAALVDGTLEHEPETQEGTWHIRGVSMPDPAAAPRPEDPHLGTTTPPPAKQFAPAPSLGRFAAVAVSQLVSITGSALTEFAVPLWLYTQTGSLTTFAVLATLGLVPGLLVLPLAGAIVDRTDRRKVMLLSDLAAGGTQAAMIALLALGHLDTAAVYVMIAMLSLALTFQRLSYASAVPQLVPKRYLGHANGLVQMSGGLAQLVVPVVAVAALSWFGIAGILIIDVATYAVSIAIVLCVRFPATLAHSRRETVTAEIRHGLAYSLRRPGLRAMLLYFAALNVFLSPLLLMMSPLAISVGDVATAGHVAVAAGAGALSGGLAVGIWGGPRRDRMRGMLACAAALGLCGVLAGSRPALALIAAGAFGMLFLLAVVNGVYATIVQTKVPQRFHGRVFALNTLVAWSTIPLGFAVIAPAATAAAERWMAADGPLAGTVGAALGTGQGRGIALVYVVFGLCVAALSLAARRHRLLARFDQTTPDAEPDDLVGLAALGGEAPGTRP
ncbi:non-ribosomal peptide synthetase/MFS transporter [Catellatospora methionotrophica]|uniref:non-ribosomal peptide synthetase/MFS transporter n=1 Tax=Catellatospora methionotrophica TaxID=121620 RepID=UPI0033DE79D1